MPELADSPDVCRMHKQVHEHGTVRIALLLVIGVHKQLGATGATKRLLVIIVKGAHVFHHREVVAHI
jgi:hypothetical protein